MSIKDQEDEAMIDAMDYAAAMAEARETGETSNLARCFLGAMAALDKVVTHLVEINKLVRPDGYKEGGAYTPNKTEAAIRALVAAGVVTVTTDCFGNVVSVTRNDAEGRELSVIWAWSGKDPNSRTAEGE